MKLFVRTIIGISTIILVSVGMYNVSNRLIDFSNTEISLVNQFKQAKQERITFYDKMYKQIAQSSQIAIKNDSAFANIVNMVMSNQPTNLNLMLGAVKLIDPSANYSQVSQFYSNLTNIVNSNREGFFQQERTMQNIAKDHENHIHQWPGYLYNLYFKRPSISYTPILSSIATNVDSTGIDDNIKIL